MYLLIQQLNIYVKWCSLPLGFWAQKYTAILTKEIDLQVVTYHFINSKQKLFADQHVQYYFVRGKSIEITSEYMCMCVCARVCVKDSWQTFSSGYLGGNWPIEERWIFGSCTLKCSIFHKYVCINFIIKHEIQVPKMLNVLDQMQFSGL